MLQLPSQLQPSLSPLSLSLVLVLAVLSLSSSVTVAIDITVTETLDVTLVNCIGTEAVVEVVVACT